MEFVYHGSHASGIASLQPVSSLHGSPETKVVYLSGSAPYSIFYIWDAKHNLTSRKYVTCGLKNGVVHYEEQFPGQLRAFYQGVSGYLYSIEKTAEMFPVANRENMWACPHEAHVYAVEFIPDVYERIMRYADEGLVRISQASDEFKAEIDEYIAKEFLLKGLINTPEAPDALFYARFFPRAWSLAQSADVNNP